MENKIQLTEEQQHLKEKLIFWLENNQNKNNYFGILGAGGTGKTFLICNALKNYSDSIIFLGATNKVVGNLKKGLIANHFEKPITKTIDSFLGFRIIKDFENKNKIVYRMPSKKNIPKIIVIDEVSMITQQKFQQLEKIANSSRLILLGDNLQLPPIEEEKQNSIRNENGFLISPIFTKLNKENSETLTIQNRQNVNSELFSLINGFRNNIEKKMNPFLIAEKKQNNLDIFYFKTNSPELKKFLKENICTAVCYKNLTVLSLNWLIGSTLSMKKDYRLNQINIGDNLIFDAFYSDKSINYYTSDLVKIVNIEENLTEIFIIKDSIKKIITYNLLTIIDDFGNENKIKYILGGLYGSNGGGLSSSVYGQRKTYLNQIRNGKNIIANKEFLKDLNTRFSDYQNTFAKLKRPYAISCHKAQGSTYNNVIIPVYDFFSINHQDANQLLYVAMSRAKEKIIFIEKESNFKENNNRYSFSEFEKQSICSAYNYKCNVCQCNLVEREFDIDHILPIANGGKNSIDNLQPLCKSCHAKKTAKEKYL